MGGNKGLNVNKLFTWAHATFCLVKVWLRCRCWGRWRAHPRIISWKVFRYEDNGSKLQLHPTARERGISLWSWLFFCFLFDTFPVISVQKFDIPEKIYLEGSGAFFSPTCCLQLLLPQPQIVTISLKTARKQSPKSLVVFDVAKSLMFFPCSDTASFIGSAANSTLAT